MSQSTRLQLCDLVHPELQELMQGCSHIAECNEQTGGESYIPDCCAEIHPCCLSSTLVQALVLVLQLVLVGRDLHDCSHQHHALHSGTNAQAASA